MSKDTNQTVQNSDAEFLGWQEIPGRKPIALYNITAVDHPLYGSTVSENTLRKYNLQIPQIPSRQ